MRDVPPSVLALIVCKALFYLGAVASVVGLVLWLLDLSGAWVLVAGLAAAGMSVATLYGLSRVLAGRLGAMGQADVITIYMPLLNQGTEKWRPVEGMRIAELGYMVTEPAPTDEEWAFQPGHILRCEERQSSDGPRLVAVGKAT